MADHVPIAGPMTACDPVSARWQDCAEDVGRPCDLASIGSFPDVSGKVENVEVIRCRKCGIGFTMPPLQDVAFLYESRESQDFQPRTSGLAHFIKTVAFRREARRLVRQIPSGAARVLDFGCGSGLFTRCLGDILSPSCVTGSDFHQSPPADLADRAYVPMDALAPLEGTFDVVLAMHVLEHDDDVAGLLARITSMCRPGGCVVIEVPNVDCVWAGLFGTRWDAWYAPFHRTHFTRRSLEHRLVKHGLEVLAVHDLTVPTMGRTLANCFGKSNSLPWLLAGLALNPVQWAAEKLTRRASAIRIIARV